MKVVTWGCPGCLWGVCIHSYLSYATVSLGELPGKETLEGVPLFSKESETVTVDPEDPQESASVRVAQQTNTLMSLITVHESPSAPSKASRVWLGEGLGSIPRRVHERMLRWEFMDMSDFRPRSVLDPATSGTDTEKLVVLPGFEVAQPRKKPVNDFITWVQCFSRYTAAMSKQYPNCTSGFMSHLLIVLKAVNEVEHPAWREYDEAYREKMASTGNKAWSGMDVALYQELCGSRQRQRGLQTEKREVPRGKRPISGRGKVCWLYNDSICTHDPCKFPHMCEVCYGSHPKRHCLGRAGADRVKGSAR